MSWTILLIDDRPTSIERVESCLSNTEYRILVASNTTTASDLLLSEEPDLLLLGLELPNVFAFLRHCHENPALPQLPAITLLRTQPDHKDIFVGWELGIDAYLLEPFPCGELRAYIKRIFQSIEEDRHLQAQETS